MNTRSSVGSSADSAVRAAIRHATAHTATIVRFNIDGASVSQRAAVEILCTSREFPVDGTRSKIFFRRAASKNSRAADCARAFVGRFA